MDPNNIKRLIASAKNIREMEDHPTPFFLVAWTAWEALRFRFLRILINRHGWFVKDANEVLRNFRISNMECAQRVVERLGEQSPNHWRGNPGKIWRLIVKMENVRNRLTHGYDSLDPKLIRDCGNFLIDILENRSWLESYSIKDNMNNKIPIGSLFQTQTKVKRKNARTVEELYYTLEISNNKHTAKSKLPDSKEISSLRNDLMS